MEFLQTNILLVAIALVSGLWFVWLSIRRPSGKVLSPVAATRLINHEDAIIVDVREDAEFFAGHLPEARHLPLRDFDALAHELDSLKERAILVTCAAGARADSACARLGKRGFTRLHLLEGGVDAWQRAGLPVIRSKKK
jgi:rhodanese-related sulfurtransferase